MLTDTALADELERTAAKLLAQFYTWDAIAIATTQCLQRGRFADHMTAGTLAQCAASGSSVLTQRFQNPSPD